ncbi:MAG: PfkB family carbohydrate kinase, partial [Hyphomicrobiaceae bacterium]
MSRVICLGHAALDRLYRIEAFPPHPTKVRAIEHIESGGGMAANAAATIARLGGKVELWSRIGEDDAGVKIRTGLKAYGVDIRYVQMFDEGRSSTSAIIVDDAGERLIVGNRDTNMPSGTSWLPLERVAKASAVMADVRWLEGLRALFTQARAEGVTTVLDADLGAREALSEVLELTDFAIFSEPALKDFAAGQEPELALARVLEMGPRHAGVTLGPKGYLWTDHTGTSRMPAFEVDVVDTTGAGDAFHGAFTLALVEGLDATQCARFAAAAAALKCTRLGS